MPSPRRGYWLLMLLGVLGLPLNSIADDPSVLSSGSWYRIAVVQSGIYRMDKAFFQRLGIDTDRLDPRNIRLYGNGGRALPQSNSASRPAGLLQNAILVEGEEDGRFDAGDAVYFYGEGTTAVLRNEATGRLYHEINPYSDTTYYFLTVGNAAGQRIRRRTSPDPAGPYIREFDHYWHYEKETTNLLQSGRSWWADYLGVTSRLSMEPALPGVLPGTAAVLRASVIAAAQVNTKFTWTVNGKAVGEQSVGPVSTYIYDLKAQQARTDFEFMLDNGTPPDNFVVSVNFDRNGQAGASAYLDYAGLQTRRRLSEYKPVTVYRFPAVELPVSYEIDATDAAFRLWDITDRLSPEEVLLSRTGGATARFTGGEARIASTYIGFTASQALEPAGWKKIANQDLRSAPAPDLLIVTAAAWKSQADRLAQFRRENDGLDVLVATTEEIYHEFASGQPDVTAIRDFCRYLYERNPRKLRYLLLFGDATFDFRDKNGVQTPLQRDSWVPSYQSRESLHPVYTYASDDYYGMLEPGSGMWEEDVSGDRPLQVGTGRLPVKNEKEAELIVDKLIRYASSRGFGSWRNEVTFVADDGDENIHQDQADFLAGLAEENFLSRRVFVDEFPQQGSGATHRAPQVNERIRRAVDQGTLVLNFTGHGGVSGWTDEHILTLADIQAFRGYYNMPLLMTATCEFGRYDNPSLVSGAELMLLSPRGASVGAMTTTRPVYASTNFTLNSAFYRALSEGIKTGGRLGDIIRDTKNNSLAGVLNRNFVLLGDPSMRLASPELGIRWEIAPDTLKALKKAVLSGEIVYRDTQKKAAYFHGTARISVYDRPEEFRTLGSGNTPASYSEYRQKLFEGLVTVKDGVFRTEFIVPGSVVPEVGTGRVSIYAVNADSTVDAGGQLGIMVGGQALQDTPDVTPPLLHAYLDSPSFENGQAVETNAVLYVEISDESGVHPGNGPADCAMKVVLNDTLSLPVSGFYTASLDDFREGTIILPLGALPEGSYRLRIEVCDVAGNKAETLITFEVGKMKGIFLDEATVFPNPFEEQIRYRVGHSREDEDIEISFRLYSRNGQLLKDYSRTYYHAGRVIEGEVPSPLPHPASIHELQIYLFDMTVRSLQDLSVQKISGKLLHK